MRLQFKGIGSLTVRRFELLSSRVRFLSIRYLKY